MFFLKESSKLTFQIFYWRYQHLVGKCNVHCIHMTKVNFGSNLTIVSLLCLIYEGWHFTTIYGNHLHDRIIPIRGRIWPLKLLVVYPRHFLLKCPYARTLRGHVLVCLGYRCCLFFLLDFGNDPMMSYLLFFHIIAKVNPIYKFCLLSRY